VVFLDEIEKSLAGAKGDLSGVSQDSLGSLLAYMQDHTCAGVIFIGPPGSAKSMVAKAAGNEAGIPTIQFDLGATRGSLVGQSEAQLRTALKVITAVSSGNSLWIATCNSIASLPPELRRRFTLGTFFFDLPASAERDRIWNIYLKKFAVGSEGELPPDDGWTGAEIKQCCENAWRMNCTLSEAAQFVVPVSRSAAEEIEKLRSQADGRFLSASCTGVYRKSQRAGESRNISL
jgi:SpoVK/Ycf46/Vps4 family AAA+-type ATPase